jgi:hypothetical protein
MFIRHFRSRALLAGALLAALACGACSGGTPTAAPPSTSGPFAQALAYSSCMRSHGLPNFPDPQQTGNGMKLSVGKGSGVDSHSPVYAAAQRACQSSQPGLGSKGGTVDPTKVAPWAACVRAHGLPRFPDPTVTDGGLTLNLAGTGIDPRSSTFQQALNACKALRAGGGLLIKSGSGGGS